MVRLGLSRSPCSLSRPKATLTDWLKERRELLARYTEIVVQFKQAPYMMFRDSLVRREQVPPNTLVLRIQPNEGIAMRFGAKVPGPSLRVGSVNMDYRSMVMDGEVMVLLSKWQSLTGMIDFLRDWGRSFE